MMNARRRDLQSTNNIIFVQPCESREKAAESFQTSETPLKPPKRSSESWVHCTVNVISLETQQRTTRPEHGCFANMLLHRGGPKPNKPLFSNKQKIQRELHFEKNLKSMVLVFQMQCTADSAVQSVLSVFLFSICISFHCLVTSVQVLTSVHQSFVLECEREGCSSCCTPSVGSSLSLSPM